MGRQVESYLVDIVEIFVHGSATKDIDHFLSQLHEDIKYEHKEYEADFIMSEWRKAFNRQLELGFYKESRRMHEKKQAAVEYSYETYTQVGVLEKGLVKFALFGFKDDKVSLVGEYW